MASRASLLVMLAAVVILPPPASSQNRKTIANPDFPCGEPYGPNGELPESSRRKRQILFPDEPKYADYLQLLLGKAFTRAKENTEDDAEADKGFCGANVISDQFILTAGHCVEGSTEKITTVILGDIDLTQEDEENSRVGTYEITDIFVHPEYSHDSPTRYHDVALLKTKTKIQFNDAVFPMCISDEIPAPGTIVIISGFGYYNATHRPDYLLEANFTVMDTTECEAIYLQHGQEAFVRVKYPNLLKGTDIICAIDDVSDACQGDSGGPVLREKDGKMFIEGIVSGGANCHANFKSVLPGLYTSIAKQIDFIDRHVYGSAAAVP
ncbi:chymotrypsinogen B-like [Scylla paramamosain]|uniref:chymotrypsinogen B-like n=1 Tax=Scylla paramamosain TaxID=85552 RepID=UPI003082DBF5